MTSVHKIALAVLGLAVIAPAATGGTWEEYRARRDYETATRFAAMLQVCGKGKIEERLDCLGQEIYALKQALQPRVHPLGLLGGE